MSDHKKYLCPKCFGTKKTLTKMDKMVTEDVIITDIHISQSGVVYHGNTLGKKSSKKCFSERFIL